MRSITLSEFQNIAVVAQNDDGCLSYCDLMNVRREQITLLNHNSYLNYMYENHQRSDLVIIDIDSVGMGETVYLVFMASSFMRDTPVVLVTRKLMPDSLRSKCLQSLGVLDIVQLDAKDSSLIANLV